MPVQHRVKRHFVTSTDDGPLVTVYPTPHSVLPMPLKTAACRSLQEARTIDPSAGSSPSKTGGGGGGKEGGGAESPIIRRRGAPTLVFAEVGSVPSSFGTGALDDAELQRRERLGVLKRRPCAFCGSVFGTEHLKHRVSRKAIVEQLAMWGRTNLRPRDLTAANLYEAVSVCVFCAQFFDDDALLRRCDVVQKHTKKSPHGFSPASRRSSTASNVGLSHGSSFIGSSFRAGGGGGGQKPHLSLFGPVEDQIERRLHQESVEARRMLASVLQDDSDEAAAAHRHEAAREEAQSRMMLRIRDDRRAEVAKLKQKLQETIASQQRAKRQLERSNDAVGNEDEEQEDGNANTGKWLHDPASNTDPSGSVQIHVGNFSPRSATNESDSFSASTSASHFVFHYNDGLSASQSQQQQQHHQHDSGDGDSKHHHHHHHPTQGDPLDILSQEGGDTRRLRGEGNTTAAAADASLSSKKRQPVPIVSNRCTELRALTCKRKRELQRMRLELQQCEALGLPVDAQFRMQYEQLSLWCNDRTRHAFEQSAIEEELELKQRQQHNASSGPSCTSKLWFQAGAVKPVSLKKNPTCSRPGSAASVRKGMDKAEERVERPRSALAAHREQHQAVLDRREVRNELTQQEAGNGVDPLYARWFTSQKVSARFSMYKI